MSKRKPTKTHQSELVRLARAVARHQRHIRELRRRIKETQALLKLDRAELRHLVNMATPSPDIVPSHLFHGDAGFRRDPVAKVVTPVDNAPLIDDADDLHDLLGEP